MSYRYFSSDIPKVSENAESLHNIEDLTKPLKEECSRRKQPGQLMGKSPLPCILRGQWVSNNNGDCFQKNSFSTTVFLRDSWQSYKLKIEKMKLGKLQLRNTAKELALKFQLYKHLLKDEQTKIQDTETRLEIYYRNMKITSAKLTRYKNRRCAAKMNCILESKNLENLKNERAHLELELPNQILANKNLKEELAKARVESNFKKQELIELGLESWVLSNCMKEDLTAQVSEVQAKIKNLEAAHFKMTLSDELLAKSLIEAWNSFTSLRAEMDELCAENKDSEKINSELQTELVIHSDENLMLRAAHDQFFSALEKQCEKAVSLQNDLAKLEFHNSEDLDDVQKFRLERKHTILKHTFFQVSLLILLKVLLGFDHQYS